MTLTEAPLHCSSCKRELPREELAQALTVFWEAIPGRLNCRDADACFDAYVAAGYPESDPLPADWKPSR